MIYTYPGNAAAAAFNVAGKFFRACPGVWGLPHIRPAFSLSPLRLIPRGLFPRVALQLIRGRTYFFLRMVRYVSPFSWRRSSFRPSGPISLAAQQPTVPVLRGGFFIAEADPSG